jgi:phytoene/squalene synthetase
VGSRVLARSIVTVSPMPPGADLEPATIAARSGSNFLIGFRCLPADRRDAMTTIYAFCRLADDAVDEPDSTEEAQRHLEFWQHELAALDRGCATTPVGASLHRVLGAFGGTTEPYRELLQGMQMDLQGIGYGDLAALEVYCRRVASAPGMACLPVLGATGPVAENFAENLGQALQLTNILRDLRPDALDGRVYAPRDWLLECGVEADWLQGTGPEAAYADGGPLDLFCRRMARAARERFVATDAALARLSPADRRRLVPARIMGAVYRQLLERLEARGGDLRKARVRVSRARRVWIALTMLLGVRR